MKKITILITAFCVMVPLLAACKDKAETNEQAAVESTEAVAEVAEEAAPVEEMAAVEESASSEEIVEEVVEEAAPEPEMPVVVANYDTPLYIESAETGEHHEFMVEVASTQDAVMQGLMYRSSMEPNQGMLFVFPRENRRNFWMKNTLIPLDIVFLKSDDTILHIHENAVPLDESLIPSHGYSKNVIELNAGTAARLGIKVGDIVSLSSVGDEEVDAPAEEPTAEPVAEPSENSTEGASDAATDESTDESKGLAEEE